MAAGNALPGPVGLQEALPQWDEQNTYSAAHTEIKNVHQTAAQDKCLYDKCIKDMGENTQVLKGHENNSLLWV